DRLDDRDEALQAIEREAVLSLGSADAQLRERLLQVRAQLRRRRAGRSRDEDVVVTAGVPAEDRLGGLQVEHGNRRGAERLDVTELGGADDLVGLARAVRDDVDSVADAEVLLTRGAGVDDDLTGAGRPAAFLDVQRVELLVGR